MRISRPEMFMQIARVVSQRATCMRLSVGAVIVVNNRPVSIGYNGAPAGDPHCSGNQCPGRFGCHETLHAERNALGHLPASVLGFNQDMDLYVTDSPCEGCANLLRAYPVKRVFFEKPYRLTDGIDLLISHGVEVYQVTPSGYVLDWKTREIVDEL